MIAHPILSALSSRRMASLVSSATRRVIYAAPGIQTETAKALAERASGFARPSLTISLDFDEHTLRMGYGSLEGVEILRQAGVEPTHSPGLRCGILIVDDCWWIFTPTALYLELEPQSDETPNAVELSPDQVTEVAIRLSQTAQKEAIKRAATPKEAHAIAEIRTELGVNLVEQAHFDAVKRAIETAPPVKFNVARQVRVFEPYLQYVEIKLTGAAIQKHKVALPQSLQEFTARKELKERLRTTFDLIEKDSELSSKEIDERVNELRKSFTPSLGERLGRVMLKKRRPLFDERVRTLKAELQAYQERVRRELQGKLDESRDMVIGHFLPLAIQNPPDLLLARVTEVNEATVTRWLERELEKAFPKAEELIKDMRLDVQFKDVTWETLNDPDFTEAIRKAFEDVDWDRPFHDFKAAGESDSPAKRMKTE